MSYKQITTCAGMGSPLVKYELPDVSGAGE